MGRKESLEFFLLHLLPHILLFFSYYKKSNDCSYQYKFFLKYTYIQCESMTKVKKNTHYINFTLHFTFDYIYLKEYVRNRFFIFLFEK